MNSNESSTPSSKLWEDIVQMKELQSFLQRTFTGASFGDHQIDDDIIALSRVICLLEYVAAREKE
ncbi:MAG: hypothetical protein C5B60_10220 [Chloroflexi bacterium]|nr:MAG: hypothetical protein C5B60_10220 [Chloroflexota bacterium]